MRFYRVGGFIAGAVFGLSIAGCGGGGGSASETTSVPEFSSGILTGRAAISSPPIIVNMPGVTATALVGNFVALKAVNPPSDYRNSRIVFTSTRSGSRQVYIMDADGSDITQVTNEPANVAEPTLSKDGTRIAYRLTGPTQSDLFIINVDGSGRTALTNTPTFSERSPTFSGDGTRVAYERNANGSSDTDIFIVNVSTKAVSQVTSTGDAKSPSWDVQRNLLWISRPIGWLRYTLNGVVDEAVSLSSASVQVQAGPTADTVVYKNIEDVYQFSVSGGSIIVDAGNPDWVGGLSPDAKYLLLGDSFETSAPQLYIRSALGGSLTRITNDIYDYREPEWGPAPRSSTLIGSSNALGVDASGFIYAQTGPNLQSALAFKATTQSTVVVATQPQTIVGPNIVYTIDADNLTAVSYANGIMLKPIRVVGPGAEVGNADGAIVTIDAADGKIVNVLAFVGTRSGKPTIAQEGGQTVYKGEFVSVFGSDGKSHGPASTVRVGADGSITLG